MDKLAPLLDWLAQGPTPECDRILAAGLEHAQSPWFERICDTLRTRGRPAAWGALAGVYPRLPQALQRELADDPDRLRLAIAEAIKLPAAHIRLGAVALLDQFPFVQLAYVLADALRDPSKDVCRTAALQLRKLATSFLKQYPAPKRDDPPQVVQARQQLARALLDALRAFDVHWRLEPVQAALWFARDLGDDLWTVLDNKRAHCRLTVLERLEEWDDPRLASFYLAALGHPEWAQVVQPALARWQDRGAVAALFEHVDLLEDADFRTRLGRLRQVQWFAEIDDFLLDLPPHLRQAAPRWVGAAPLSDEHRTATLSRWLQRPCPLLRRACAYGLARIDADPARRRLEQLAADTRPGAQFARWWRAGRQNARTGAAPANVRTLAVEPPTEPQRAKPAAADDPAFDAIWRLLGRVSVRENGALLNVIRQQLPLWERPLLARLTGDSPRDRLLALHVLATSALAPRYVVELRQRLSDDVKPIRDLAQTLLASAAEAGAAENDDSLAPPPLGPPPQESVDDARESLLRYLGHLLAGQAMVQLTESAVAGITELAAQYRAAVEHETKPHEEGAA